MMGWRAVVAGGFLLLGMGCVSCVEYTPKPRGYVRIEPPEAVYRPLGLDGLPFDFEVSRSASVGAPDRMGGAVGLSISYPGLGATIHCGYLPVTPESLAEAVAESRSLVARQARPGERVAERAYADPGADVYGSLFLLGGDAASPIQFLLTDSVSNFFRGALYFDCRPNADSLAPAVRYIREDIIELMQTFSWRER